MKKKIVLKKIWKNKKENCNDRILGANSKAIKKGKKKKRLQRKKKDIFREILKC